MNREEFLQKLFTMYGKSFNNDNNQEWWDAYKQVLNANIDFDALYSTMLIEYDGKSAPSPAWLRSKSTFKANLTGQNLFLNMSEERRGALVTVARWFNSEAYQWYREPTPFNIRDLIRRHGFEADEINKFIVLGQY